MKSPPPSDWPEDGSIDLSIHDRPHASSTTEWWYQNGHLEAGGQRYSFFAAFFRQVKGYDESIRTAVSRGIKVFPVASSESDDQAEAVFRQIAQATGARFVFLSYGAGGAATGASTDIDSTDYEELALDDLVVRSGRTPQEVLAVLREVLTGRDQWYDG